MDQENITITGGSTSYVIVGLEEGSKYTITVTASNAAGSSGANITAMIEETGKKESIIVT